MISGIAASTGRPERGLLRVDVRQRLNSFTQLYTVLNDGVDMQSTLRNSAFMCQTFSRKFYCQFGVTIIPIL